jgi:hypothetical protein
LRRSYIAVVPRRGTCPTSIRSDLAKFEEYFELFDDVLGYVSKSQLTPGRCPKSLRGWVAFRKPFYEPSTRVPRDLKSLVAIVSSVAYGAAIAGRTR